MIHDERPDARMGAPEGRHYSPTTVRCFFFRQGDVDLMLLLLVSSLSRSSPPLKCTASSKLAMLKSLQRTVRRRPCIAGAPQLRPRFLCSDVRAPKGANEVVGRCPSRSAASLRSVLAGAAMGRQELIPLPMVVSSREPWNTDICRRQEAGRLPTAKGGNPSLTLICRARRI